MTMATMAAGVLLSQQTQCLRGFSVNGNTFNPVDLQKLGFNILMGSNPKVRYKSDLSSLGQYDSYDNTMWFRFNSVTSVMEKSNVVHEATHAACDMNRQKMTVAYSEVMAYIVQAQFARANNPYPNQRYLQGATWQSDRVYEIAWMLAGKLLGGATLTALEVSNLKDAICANPTYASEASNVAGYGGI